MRVILVVCFAVRRAPRSISIFDGKKGELVWDSGDFMEQFIADPANGFSDIFNSEGGERSRSRSSKHRGNTHHMHLI